MRLVRLVEDLQQLAKADAAKAFLNKQLLSFTTLFDRLLTLYKPNFQDKNITLHTCFNDAADQISADQEKLMHAVRNLIENAWQYTPPNGEVEISLTASPQGVRAEIVNTGPGIAAKDLPYIFERFFRADRSRTRSGAAGIGKAVSGGSGIGLSIVKEIIQAHGGQVGAESTMGKTNIWFELPR